MYRKDLFEQAGIKVPQDPNYQPHWQEVADWAKTIKRRMRRTAGICLRGKPGWGEVLAPLDTVINTFGGRWFDEKWNAQLNSPEVEKAVQLLRRLGPRRTVNSGPATSGFSECANQFGQGQTAMWYDATSAVSVLEDPESSESGRQDRIRARADRRKGSLRLAVQLVARHPQGSQESGRRLEVHLLDDQQASTCRWSVRNSGLGAGPSGQPDCRPTRFRSTSRPRPPTGR